MQSASNPVCEGESSSEALDRCNATCLEACPAAGDVVDGDATGTKDASDCTPAEGASADCSCQCPGADAWTSWSLQPCVGEQASEALDRCSADCLAHCP